MHHEVWGEITYPFPSYNDRIGDVLGMDKQLRDTLYWPCDFVSMLELKLTHVGKSGPLCQYVE